MLFWAVGAVRAVKENDFNFIKYPSFKGGFLYFHRQNRENKELSAT